ncbi:TPA: hypothetical protein ACE6I5_002242, partial [Neisseria gonorrhoeae]
AADVFGSHGLCGLPEEGVHGKSPKCLGGNLGDFGDFCKGLRVCIIRFGKVVGECPRCRFSEHLSLCLSKIVWSRFSTTTKMPFSWKDGAWVMPP